MSRSRLIKISSQNFRPGAGIDTQAWIEAGPPGDAGINA
jgi:hypothetical protein